MANQLFLCCGSRIASYEDLLNIGRQVESNMDNSVFRETLFAVKAMRLMRPAISRMRKYGLVDFSDLEDFATKGMHTTFLEVLRQSRRHNGCTDPRDLLYSRMALASDVDLLIPYPDYDIPVEELYKRFATNSIMRTSSLDVIAFATSTDRQIPTWVPDWTSLHAGWQSETNFLGSSLADLKWSDKGLPRVSTCRSELMVQGKTLKTFRSVESDYLIHSILLNLAKYPADYPMSEVPRFGDIICILRGSWQLVYLRPVKQHFIIVGRAHSVQDKLFQPQGGLVTMTREIESTKRKEWTLNAIEDIQGRQEQIFRIR